MRPPGSPADRRPRSSPWCRRPDRDARRHVGGEPISAAWVGSAILTLRCLAPVHAVGRGGGHGVWRSLVARFVRDEEAAGSNPVTPTRKTAGHGPSCVRLEAPWLESTAAKYSSWPCHQLERGAPARSVRGDRRPPLICSEQRLLADAGAGFSGSGARLPKGGTGVAIFVCGYFHRVRISSRLNAARAAKNRTTTRVARAPASVSIEPGLRMRIPISDET
jgi:hypothetical protein